MIAIASIAMVNNVLLNPAVGDLLGHELNFVAVVPLFMCLSRLEENQQQVYSI